MKHYGASNQKVSTPLVSSGPPIRSSRNHKKTHKSGRGLWYVALVLILGLFFGLSIFFTKATVTVVPITKEIPLNERFVAYKKSTSRELTFDVMMVDGSVQKTVTSQTKETVEEKATGTVRIYNAHSAEKQSLLIDTRLADEKGRLYKTVKKIIVPGWTIVDGKTEPGFVDVDVYADKAGTEFNEEGELELKLIGFKEAKSPKYDTLYAKTITSLSGGFIGERYVVSDEQKKEIVDALTQDLQSSLHEKSLAQVPENTLFPEKLSTLINTNVKESVSDNGEIQITLEGSLFSILFNKLEFEKYILKTSIVGVDRESAYIANLDTLAINYVDQSAQTVSPESLEDLAFQVDDVLEIISIINKEALRFDLVGKKKKDFENILSSYPGIEHVEYNIDPFWRSRFPDSDEDITVVITSENTK